MAITDEEYEAFKEAAKPLVKWLCENGHPHMQIIVCSTGAEVVEGIATAEILDFLRD